jgi:hypothetical protein
VRSVVDPWLFGTDPDPRIRVDEWVALGAYLSNEWIARGMSDWVMSEMTVVYVWVTSELLLVPIWVIRVCLTECTASYRPFFIKGDPHSYTRHIEKVDRGERDIVPSAQDW